VRTHIHVVGASGSGTTTIGARVASQLGFEHLDTDDYFWVDTPEPFTVTRPLADRLRLLGGALAAGEAWVLSGSITGWGESLASRFDLVIRLEAPDSLRLTRLRDREYARYGDRALPGGDHFEDTEDFLTWAAAYESGTREGRSRPVHEAWLDTLTCPVVRIVNLDLDESVAGVVRAIGS